MPVSNNDTASAEIWMGDHFGRQDDASFLEEFLVGRSRELEDQGASKSFVVNIDADWGEGKSFFLDRFKRQLNNHGFAAAYVDAWANDFAEDPMTVVMAAIDDEVNRLTKPASKSRKAWKKTVETGGKVAEQVLKGLAIRTAQSVLTAGVTNTILETLSGTSAAEAAKAGESAAQMAVDAFQKVLDDRAEASVSHYKAAQASMERFRENLAKFVQTLSTDGRASRPFFVFVDELDRCRPLFAISMLERIKHLFNVPSVVFVVATATTQLSHSVRAVYGTDFDGVRYLNRFFDRTYLFDKPSKAQFLDALMSRYPLDADKLSTPMNAKVGSFLSDYFFYANLQARTIEQIYDLLRTIVTAWSDDVPIQIAVMLPLIQAYHSNPGTFDADFSGGIQPLLKFSGGWLIPYKHKEEHQPWQTRDASMPMVNLISKVWEAGNSDLSDWVGKNQQRNQPEIWVHQVFWNEFDKKYNGRSRSPGSPSIVASYPKIVRRAGRIQSPTNPDPA